MTNLVLILVAFAGGEHLKRVDNGLTPARTHTIQFQETLRFGGEDAEEDEMLWSGVDPFIAAAPSGDIYIADRGETRILRFDKDGRFIKQITGKGNGPGELQELRNIAVLSDGRLVALNAPQDSGRLFWFDASGTYEKKFNPDKHLIRATFSPKGQAMAGFTLEVTPERSLRLHHMVFDGEMQPAIKLHVHDMDLWDNNRATDLNYLRDRFAKIIRQELGPKMIYGFDGLGRLYTASTGAYEITRYSADLKEKQLLITKKYKPRFRTDAEVNTQVENRTARSRELTPEFMRHLITENMMRKAFEKAELAPNHPPLEGLLPTADGHLIVARITDEAGTTDADLFSPEGVFLGSFSMKHYALMGFMQEPRMVFVGNHAYTVETDEDGEHQAVRYKLAIAKE